MPSFTRSTFTVPPGVTYSSDWVDELDSRHGLKRLGH
jgi:hypothetical protein